MWVSDVAIATMDLSVFSKFLVDECIGRSTPRPSQVPSDRQSSCLLFSVRLGGYNFDHFCPAFKLNVGTGRRGAEHSAPCYKYMSDTLWVLPSRHGALFSSFCAEFFFYIASNHSIRASNTVHRCDVRCWGNVSSAVPDSFLFSITYISLIFFIFRHSNSGQFLVHVSVLV